MDRRSFLSVAGAFLFFGALPATSGCGRRARRRRAVRRAVRRHRRRRRRFRRFVRRQVRRRGVMVPVIVFPVTVQTGDVVVLEDHGECEVQTIEETRVQVATSGGGSVWVDVVIEGEDEGEEIPE